MRIALFHDKAAIHKDDLIRHIPCKGHFVSDDDHGGFLLGKSPDDLQNLAGQLRVQRRGRLIKAENVRVQCQGPCNGYPLLLAAGELMRIVICAVGKSHLGQQLHSGGADILAAFTVVFCHELPGQRYIFKSRVLREKIEGLKDHSEMEPLFPNLGLGLRLAVRGIKQYLILHSDCPGVRCFQKIKAAQQRCLSAAGGADDRQCLPLFQGKADVIEDLCVIEMLLQMLNRQN